MKCPHCLVEYHSNFDDRYIGKDADADWWVAMDTCPNEDCRRMIAYLVSGIAMSSPGGPRPTDDAQMTLIRPKGISRTPLPSSVPQRFADDYREACLVLADSPKASAALSRRCLQNLLREQAGVKHSDLFNEIQQVIDSGSLPSDLAENIDAIRVTGNFAAHPIKSQSTGEVVPVEPGEAEWNLDVLEELFDFYFVRPAIRAAKRAALNEKLQDAGKPPMQ
ncbi:MAG: DUF4145 domain-containing protein [Actinomycetota bacterium]